MKEKQKSLKKKNLQKNVIKYWEKNTKSSIKKYYYVSVKI